MQKQIECTVVYRAKDIKDIFGIGINEAYRLMHQPNFPSFQINNRIFVEKNALDDWLRRNKGKVIITQ